MSRFWSPFVKSLAPYVPGEQPVEHDIIKLNTNENPYPPAPAVFDVLQNYAAEKLRLYPDPESITLTATIANYHQLNADNIFIGNGSDEVLAHVFNAFFRQDKAVFFPDITYSFYSVYCKLYGIEYQLKPLTAAFEIDFADYQQQNGGVIFANPNAPTGVLSSLKSIEKLLEKCSDSVVVVDEAYIDFADKSSSAIELITRFKNLLVVRTLSKSRSLAGIRVGYALGNAELINGLNRVKNSFNSYPIDRLASEMAIASFSDEAYFQTTCRRIIENRQLLLNGLVAMGFECLPSAANFLLLRHKEHEAKWLMQELRSRSILLRYFNKARLNQCLRITVGSAGENETLLQAMSEILA